MDETTRSFSSLTLGIVGAVSLPSWANNWTAKNLKPDSLELNTSEEDLLEAICEAIIPETDTPGSRTLQIPKFVKLMVTDMHKVADQDKFKKGLAKVNELSISLFGKSFEGSNTQQKLHLLQGFGMSSDENLRFLWMPPNDMPCERILLQNIIRSTLRNLNLLLPVIMAVCL